MSIAQYYILTQKYKSCFDKVICNIRPWSLAKIQTRTLKPDNLVAKNPLEANWSPGQGLCCLCMAPGPLSVYMTCLSPNADAAYVSLPPDDTDYLQSSYMSQVSFSNDPVKKMCPYLFS